MTRLISRIVICLAIAISLSGCRLLGESDEALVREIRDGLVKSTRPTLVKALDHARGHDGMIDALRTERVKTVDQMIDSVDRVYPPLDENGNPVPYAPTPLPWDNQ